MALQITDKRRTWKSKIELVYYEKFFCTKIYEKIKKNRDVVLLSADIGNRLFDKIKKDYPRNFLNCGIAEPNMITFACGLAKENFYQFATQSQIF